MLFSHLWCVCGTSVTHLWYLCDTYVIHQQVWNIKVKCTLAHLWYICNWWYICDTSVRYQKGWHIIVNCTSLTSAINLYQLGRWSPAWAIWVSPSPAWSRSWALYRCVGEDYAHAIQIRIWSDWCHLGSRPGSNPSNRPAALRSLGGHERPASRAVEANLWVELLH